jgi:hypothetical protein
MALVDDDQVEEVGRELLVDVLLFLGAGDRLIEREVDLEGLVDLRLTILVIAWPKGLKSLVLVWSARMLRSTRKRMRFFWPDFHSRQMIWKAV